MKTWTIALAFLVFAISAEANDSFVMASGGTVTPLKSNPSIRMVMEEIYVKLPEAIVEAKFVFKNEGPETKIQMGFPEESYNVPEMKKGQKTRFRWFKSTVNGKPIAVSRRALAPKSAEDYGEHYWWVKDVSFKKGETKVIVNRYQTVPGGTYVDKSYHEVTYIVSTGAPWKGPIGNAKITFDLGSVAKDFSAKLSSPGDERIGKLLVWKRQNFEPTVNDNITVYWIKKSPK